MHFFIYVKEDEAESLMQQLKKEHSAHHDIRLLTPEPLRASALDSEAAPLTRMMMYMLEVVIHLLIQNSCFPGQGSGCLLKDALAALHPALSRAVLHQT